MNDRWLIGELRRVEVDVKDKRRIRVTGNDRADQQQPAHIVLTNVRCALRPNNQDPHEIQSIFIRSNKNVLCNRISYNTQSFFSTCDSPGKEDCKARCSFCILV